MLKQPGIPPPITQKSQAVPLPRLSEGPQDIAGSHGTCQVRGNGTSHGILDLEDYNISELMEPMVGLWSTNHGNTKWSGQGGLLMKWSELPNDYLELME